MAERTENPKLLDGKLLAKNLNEALAAKVSECTRSFGRPPGLGVILVGENPASQIYVGNKEKAAHKAGFRTFDARLKSSSTAAEVAKAIAAFNDDPNVDGILLQLPLPSHLDSNELIDLISPHKDADGLHPFSQGLLQLGRGVVRPCTPSGCMKLIDLAFAKAKGGSVDVTTLPQADLSGKIAVVVGRSILVGKPVATMLLERNATVMIGHSKTKDLESLVRLADVLVVAIGRPNAIPGKCVKEGAVVIDVGINRLPDGRVVGDVDFEPALARADSITPVPGGVGPMTIAMLLQNTFAAYVERNSKR